MTSPPEGSGAPSDIFTLSRLDPPSDVHRRLDAIGHDVDSGKLAAARAQLAGMMAAVEGAGQVDEVSVARALLGRIHDRLKAVRQAQAEYDAVARLWVDPAATSQRVGLPADDEETRSARLARALDALGQALFFQAEQLRRRADAIPYPTYHGPPYRPAPKRLEDMTPGERDAEMERRRVESEAVNRHIQTHVKDWVDRKKRAIEEADRAYQRILEIRPDPPPVWVVAAGARAGQMWDGFTGDFRRAPIAGWMRADAKLLAAYEKSIEDASQPMVEHARAAFRLCSVTAERYRIESNDARTCSSWLAAHPVRR